MLLKDLRYADRLIVVFGTGRDEHQEGALVRPARNGRVDVGYVAQGLVHLRRWATGDNGLADEGQQLCVVVHDQNLLSRLAEREGNSTLLVTNRSPKWAVRCSLLLRPSVHVSLHIF